MDKKVGTNNNSENTKVTLDDEMFGKLPKKVADSEKVGKVKIVGNNINADHAQADTLDIELFDQQGKLKNKNIGKIPENEKVTKHDKVDSGQIQNRKAKQHHMDKNDIIKPYNALFKDARAKDDHKLGKLKDENALFENAKAKIMNKQLSTKQEQGNVSVYTDRQSKALALQS